MTDEQIIRYYTHQERYNKRRVERYNSCPDYRAKRQEQARKDYLRYSAKRKQRDEGASA